MTEPLTEDDEGKRIVTDDGETIGTLAKVDQGVGHVRPDADVEKIRSYLNWETDDDEDYTFQETAVEEVTDEEVVLREDAESER